MKLIDIHTHAFPDELAKRAVPMLEKEADWKAFHDGRIQSLLASMDAAGIETSVVCSIATKPDQMENILNWSRQIRSDRIVPLPSIHPDCPEPAEWTRRFADEGLVGIKLHPMYQDFHVDEPRALRIYSAAAEAGLIVVLHCGLDVAFPPPDDRAEPARTRRALQAVPEMKLVATHMGGWRMWDEVDRELIGADCHMETSFTLFELPPERVVKMIRAHGVERVMFGTDSPWADQAEELQRFRALELTEAEREQILSGNARRLLGL